MAAAEKPAPVSDKVFSETTSAIIRELAASGSIVILGRGSQMILKETPRALHALCIAPSDVRYQRVAEREELSIEDAKRLAVRDDQARDAFYHRFWKAEVENPRLYDVTVETARLGYDAAAEIIAEAARLKSDA
jgi:cytidylate kinase